MDVNASSTAQLIASYIAAIGTVSAVALALFLQVFLVRKQRPQLQVTFSDDLNDEDIHLVEFPNSFGYFLRVKVWAKPKKNAANRVQGLLLVVTRPKEASGTSTRKISDGVFKWAGTLSLEQVDIAPGTWRRLDILRYSCIRDSGPPILAPALSKPSTTTHWPPSMRTRLTDAGTYSLDFVVSCEDASPTFWRLTFDFAPDDESAQSPADLANHVKKPQLKRLQ